MSFGKHLNCLSRHCRHRTANPALRRFDRVAFSRQERRAFPVPDSRLSRPFSQPVPRIDPRQQTKRNALQQSPLLTGNKGHTIHVAVEYIQLLGMRVGESLSESKILTHFGRLSAQELDEGYSTRAMAARQQLLEEAKEIALKSVGKRHKSSDRPTGIELAYHLIPGALSILAQGEEHDVVLQLGEKVLQSRDANNMKRDVLLSMALAKLGQANAYFQVPNQVAMACTCMKEALQLLTEGGSPQLAPGLCEEIEMALETYVPKCVLDQLKLPLNADNVKGRKDAIEILKGLLTVRPTSDHSFIGVDRHYVKQVVDCLTSSELLQIVDWREVLTDPKSVKWYYPGLLLKGAAVHIVVGFLQRRPVLVQQMDSILNIPGKDREAHVEHVICKVLLGDVENAYAILDKAEGNGKSEGENDGQRDVELNEVGAKILPGRNETFAFIKAHSDSDDWLAGMCIFVERWLKHAGFTQFRDTATGRVSTNLVEYFKDRKVQNTLNSATGSHNGLFGMISMNRKEDQRPVILPSPNPKSNGSVPPTTSHPPGGRGMGLNGDVQSSIAYFPSNYALQPGFEFRRPNGMWIALLGGFVLGSALFAVVRHPWMHSPKEHADGKAAQTDIKAPATPRSAAERKGTKGPMLPLRKDEAEKLVEKWQHAKAEALGPRHDFRHMRRILADPMLGTWMQNIQKVAERGLFWKYKLDHIKVTRVDPSHLHEEDGYIDVTATLKESAIMYGINGREIDRYKSRYNVAYHMIRDDEGRWRINDVKVLTSHS